MYIIIFFVIAAQFAIKMGFKEEDLHSKESM